MIKTGAIFCSYIVRDRTLKVVGLVAMNALLDMVTQTDLIIAKEDQVKSQ